MTQLLQALQDDLELVQHAHPVTEAALGVLRRFKSTGQETDGQRVQEFLDVFLPPVLAFLPKDGKFSQVSAFLVAVSPFVGGALQKAEYAIGELVASTRPTVPDTKGSVSVPHNAP